MTRGMPSMTALLGLLAIAGYQNRDKLAELLKGPGAGSLEPPSTHFSWNVSRDSRSG
ncbi:hypothetical protein ACVMGC_003930 [Bradyrhizobium barranii subsp. barranii]